MTVMSQQFFSPHSWPSVFLYFLFACPLPCTRVLGLRASKCQVLVSTCILIYFPCFLCVLPDFSTILAMPFNRLCVVQILPYFLCNWIPHGWNEETWHLHRLFLSVLLCWSASQWLPSWTENISRWLNYRSHISISTIWMVCHGSL